MIEGESSEEAIRAAVRTRYAAIAGHSAPSDLPMVSTSCCDGESGCCTDAGSGGGGGYSSEELARLPPGADLGLGCGNPTGIAGLRPGEVVLDLGSGAGVDCFLAGERVGPSGRVIGVDMTPEMLSRARANASRGGRENVEFRLGEIEHLPVADATIDVIISNCVINLAADKEKVYREAYRVLRPGGRLVVSDVLATRPIPPELRVASSDWSSCSAGALTVAETEEVLRSAGFQGIDVTLSGGSEVRESLAPPAAIGVMPGSVRANKPEAR